MKLIIDIPERYYEFCRECVFNRTDTVDQMYIANGTPYNERPHGEWIPVSERLPEDRNLVLVTAYWHETYQVMQASYFGEGEKNGWWCVPWNNCGKHMRNDLHVIAWQPLPKPYKEADNEQ